MWLFDLDDTLHHASHAIFPEINRLMTAYIARTLDSGIDEADTLRLHYWRTYGATLLGMVRHHAVDPADFLAEVHAIDDLRARLRAERGVRAMLARLPGRKILLTNAPTDYAGRVVGHLGLGATLLRTVAIENMWVHGRLRPKPDRLMLTRLLARMGVPPSRAILVEDSVGHLRRYARLGLRTVWVTGYLGPARWRRGFRPAYVDLKVKSVLDLGRQWPRLGSIDQ